MAASFLMTIVDRESFQTHVQKDIANTEMESMLYHWQARLTGFGVLAHKSQSFLPDLSELWPALQGWSLQACRKAWLALTFDYRPSFSCSSYSCFFPSPS